MRFTKYPFIALVLFLSWSPPATANSQDPEALLIEAERLFALDNWVKARPLHAEAERLFSARGDTRNALFAKFSRLRADAESVLSYPEVSRILAEDLKNPEVQRDPRLRLRALMVKATVDLSIDPSTSGEEWKEVLKLAQELGEKIWEGRAYGELSVVSFLTGKMADATKQNLTAASIAAGCKDPAGVIRQASLLGVGFLEQKRFNQAVAAFDQALDLAEKTPDVRFPLMAYMGKAAVLDGGGKGKDADALLRKAMDFVNNTNMTVYRADLLLALGNRAAQSRQPHRAIELYEQAAEAAKMAGMPRPYALAQFALTDLYVKSGDLPRARLTVFDGLAASRELVDMHKLPQHISTAAQIEQKLGHIREASALYEEARDLIESLLINVPSAAMKSSLVAVMSDVFVSHFRLALSNQQDLAAAFSILERARARVLADELRSKAVPKERSLAAHTPAEARVAAIQPPAGYKATRWAAPTVGRVIRC